MRGILIACVAAFAVAQCMLPLAHAASEKDDQMIGHISRDAVFQSAATISGLAVFGSVIGFRFAVWKEGLWQAGRILAFTGVMVLIVMQAIVMYSACCDAAAGELVIMLWILFTVFALIGVALGVTLAVLPEKFDDGKLKGDPSYIG